MNKSISPFLDMINEAISSRLLDLMVCLPGKVVAFDPDSQMAQIECGIQKRINGDFRTIPAISSVRVQFSGSDHWYFWHEVMPGTEGLIHFSQRAVDTWNDQGGPVAPHELRMFSVEDAYFVPGIRSSPKVIPGFVNEGVGMSSYDGVTRIHLSPGVIDLKAETVNIEAGTINETSTAHNVTSGTLAVKAATSIIGTLHNNDIDVGSAHTHGGVQPGSGSTGGPL